MWTFDICWHVSLKTTNVNLAVARQEKLEDHQSHQVLPMNVWTRFHGNPTNNCWEISVRTDVMDRLTQPPRAVPPKRLKNLNKWEWRHDKDADLSTYCRPWGAADWSDEYANDVNHLLRPFQSPDIISWTPVGDFGATYYLHHHHQNTKWENIFWQNGVYPCRRAHEMCKI